MIHKPRRALSALALLTEIGLSGTRWHKLSVGIFSPSYSEQLCAQLRRAGIVESKHGSGGGYRLAMPADQITLADVARAVYDAQEDPRTFDDGLAFFVARRVDVCLSGALSTVTLGDLLRDARCQGFAPQSAAQAERPPLPLPPPPQPNRFAAAMPAGAVNSVFALGGGAA